MDGANSVRLRDIPGVSGSNQRPAGRYCLRVGLRGELSTRLELLVQQQGVELFELLLASLAVLVARWSGQDEVRIGARSGRAPENTAALRIALQEGATTSQVLEQTRQALLQTRAADVSESVDLELLLSVDDEAPDHPAVTLEFATGRFERDTVVRMIDSWHVLLEGMAASPEVAIDRLPILTARERDRVLREFNQVPGEGAPDALIHELFEERVRSAPNEIALIFEERCVTYAELNRSANRLARFLRTRGVRSDDLVAVGLDRGIDLVVSMLAVLKAGGAYLPVDPDYPRERLDYMLGDASPAVLITHQRLAHLWPGSVRDVVAIDSCRDEIAACDDTDLPRAEVGLTGRSLAFVIYTSGSTGQPKGAMNEHRGMANRIVAQKYMERYSADDICCQKTSISFVDAVFEIFGALCSGCPLLIIPAAAVRDGRQMTALIAKHRATQLITVPSLARSLLDDPQVMSDLSCLRAWTLSGEPVRADLLQKLQGALPDCDFISLYGSSEVSSDAAFYRTRRFEAARVPIGIPVPNVQVYILDRHGEPVPVGVTGEIHVGGVGVGRGYLNRPELTAARFVSDPFSADAQARLYKTGDLGRWRADGVLECLGRNDHQVKIRGFRVEPGEIETHILRHGAVREGVVVAREDRPGDFRLVAYVVLRSGAANAAGRSSIDALREHLRAGLPDFMVPAAFVTLDSLPKTPNGKIDRSALPAPPADAYSSTNFEAPQGRLESILAGAWQEVLQVPRVGRLDNFFELGGHSLLILKLMGRLRARGFTVQVQDVYNSRTLAALASCLRSVADGPPDIPPNLIPGACTTIEPEMLTLVDLRQQEIDLIARAVPGGPANIQDIYPLLPLQEGILFHHLMNEHAGDAYVASTLLTVRSKARLDQLLSALQAMIDRHDILRTAVLWEDLSRPVQVVCRHANLPVDEVVLDPGRDPEAQARAWVDEPHQRIDLRAAPLLRLKIAADPSGARWFVLLQVHHIVDDDVSQKILISEIAACLQGTAGQLGPPPAFRAHVANALSHARSPEVTAFFEAKLRDVDEPTAPFGLLEVHGDGADIDESREELDSGVAHRLRAQARGLGVTPAVLFHAAWGLVVAHTSGREDVVFGTVLLGRAPGNRDVDQAVGMLINTLPLRLRFSDLTARDLVEHTQRELVDLLGHEQASLATAQRCSGVSGATPLFTAVLNYRHGTVDAADRWAAAGGIDLIQVHDRTNFPVTLSIDEGNGGFALSAKTDPRIDPRRLLQYLIVALESLLGALERSSPTPVLALGILPESERYALTHELNATRVPYPDNKLLHRLFEEQAAATPDAEAVVYEGRLLTFSQLNHRANQLARELRNRGVCAGDLVGLCVERSLDLVVGILGILKSGGAYVPLDPDYPGERLADIVHDAAPRVLLTQSRLIGRVPGVVSATICLDGEWSAIARNAGDNLDAGPAKEDAHQLAYVIYTSGSTGRPKGVMVEHRNVASLWQGLEPLYRAARPCRRVAVNASFNFDASVKQFIQLLSGRTLVIVPQETRLDPPAMLDFLAANAVDAIDCTPWQLKSWVSAGLLATPARRLSTVLIGGEPIDTELWKTLARCPDTDFFNVYGPTESTVDATFARLRADETAPHIGRPMENRQIHILDRSRQLAPAGVAGEIYIGGAGVARGYLNRPDLTAERFLPDPFAGGDARLYKTGDLGRWRQDGTIEYLGRNDHQVKIRGFRIELGEIEAQLVAHPKVKEVAVIATDEVSGEKRSIVAYVVAEEAGDAGARATVEDLRRHLERALPDYMIPAAFVMLDSFPMTPNGKLDRRALPAPDVAGQGQRPYEPPQGEVEQCIAKIWQQLLRLARVGRHDNFFDVGGHSLSAMQAIVEVRSALSIRLPVRSLFESPTLKGFSARVDALRQERLLQSLAAGGVDLEALLQRVASMPDSEVSQRVRTLRTEGQS